MTQDPLTYGEMAACNFAGIIAGPATRQACIEYVERGGNVWTAYRDAVMDTTAGGLKSTTETVQSVVGAGVETATAAPRAINTAIVAAAVIGVALLAWRLPLGRRT